MGGGPPFRVSISKVPNYPDDMPEWMKDQKPILDFEYVTVPQLLATFPDLQRPRWRACTSHRRGGRPLRPHSHLHMKKSLEYKT